MLVLTPTTLEKAYEYLRATQPFARWRLPVGGDVVFKVIRTPHEHGWYKMKNGRHIIAASHGAVGHTLTLMASMAHEMCHMRECLMGKQPNHGAAFRKMSKQVCKFHGFDPKLF